MATFSISVWTVREGREREFETAWRELSEYTAVQMVGRKEPSRLLRDRDQPNRFVSVAQWDSADTIRAWRAGPAFSERVARMGGLLEDFSPMTLDDVTKP